jgi:hypothetical protein
MSMPPPHPPPLDTNASGPIKEFFCETTIEALNNALIDQSIDPVKIVAVLYIDGRTGVLPRYHVLYRS